jgi:predicted RNA-binding Zn ribbon-like protein
VRARALRETLYRLATAASRDQALPAPDRLELNRIAKGAAATPVLTSDGTMKWDGTADSLLVLIARMGVELLGGDPAPRIRKCDGEYCAILFVDASRKGDRRWCSMSACGNKAKAADFRRRSAEGRG